MESIKLRLTLESGDLFERTHAQWLRQHLESYEDIWSRFIGNDGNNRALPIEGLAPEAQSAHKMFCQAHYSLGLFTHLLVNSAKRAIAQLHESVESKTTRTCESYLRDTENITLFLALLGQSCDMVEEIARSLGDNAIAKSVSQFMKERNNAIHAARIPMAADYVGIKIAIISHNENEPGYRNRIPWDAVNIDDFQYLEEWIETTSSNFLATLKNPVYPMIRKAATNRFGGREIRPIGLQPPSYLDNISSESASLERIQTESPPSPATTFSIAVSGVK
jgi:hypothetical protein